MIPFIYWTYYKPKMIKSPISRYVCRSKPNLLPTTLPRVSGYATTILGLSRRLYHMKHHLINRVNNLLCQCNNIPIHHMRKNYIKSINPIPYSHKKLSRMTTKFPSSRTQILRAPNHLIIIT